MANTNSENTGDLSAKERREARRKARQAKQGGKEAPGNKSKLREWIETIVFALVGVLIIRNLLFGFFVVPTPSMESEVLAGEYIVASNLHYGPRLPMTLGIPFTGVSFDAISFPYFRIPGFGSIQRGDVVVFNVPFEDRPVDYKTPYLKRLIGMPGDSLSVVDKNVHINGEPLPELPNLQQDWEVLYSDSSTQVVTQMTNEAAEEFVAERGYVQSIRPFVIPDSFAGQQVFPEGESYTRDNYGPIYIPAKGDQIELSDANWAQFERLIRVYENQDAEQIGNNRFRINGTETNTYTVKQNYYFMMGDNRDNSLDSRAWGYVPEDHIVAKAIFVLFSWDLDKGLGGARLGKWFRGINGGFE